MVKKKRARREPEQLVADLQAKIEAIKARAARKRAKANPAVRHTVAAVRSMDKAMAATADAVMRKTLEEARGLVTAYLSLQGILTTDGAGARRINGRRSSGEVEQLGATLSEHVAKNPGQRAEQIAESLQVDTKGMRLAMKKLIADGKVQTRGERRGMRYYPG